MDPAMVSEEVAREAVMRCYQDVAATLEEHLPLIPACVERDALIRCLTHFRAAASMPPLRLRR